MQNVIEIRGVTIRFGKTEIITDVSVDIPKGRIVALLGPSGTGKTTLVKAVMGMNPIASGSITVSGKPVPSFAAVSRSDIWPRLMRCMRISPHWITFCFSEASTASQE